MSARVFTLPTSVSSFFSKYHHFLTAAPFLIIFAAVLWYSATLTNTYSCFVTAPDTWCGQDVDQYKDYSDSQLTGQGFAAKYVVNMYYLDPKTFNDYVPEVMRLPAFSSLISLGRLIYDHPRLLLFYNYLSVCLIALYTYLLLKEFVHWSIGMIGFSLVILNPVLLFYGAMMGNVDIIVTAGIIATVYHFNRVLKTEPHQKYYWWKFGSALGWCVFTIFSRQNTLIFILPYMVLAIGQRYFTHQKNKAILWSGLIIVITLGLMTTWMIRNYAHTRHFMLSAASGGQLFMEFTHFTAYPTPESKQLYDWYSSPQGAKAMMAEKRAAGIPVAQAYTEIDDHLAGLAWEYISSHLHILKPHLIKSLTGFYTGSTFSWERQDLLKWLSTYQKPLHTFYLWATLLFPLPLLITKKWWHIPSLSWWLPLHTFIFLSAFFHGTVIGSRGYLPMIPLSIIMICVILHTLITGIHDIITRYYWSATHVK
ncbi:MAG TPA: hypothetical protein VD999_05330 [Vitreimonas sp.]|nr:hypothetical protein [Vitreimonas sp.]